jgi:hypothetical protein
MKLRIKLVEAAGIEPDCPQSTNWLMAHGFSRKTTIPSRFSPPIESPGVDPSRGDISETALENRRLKSKGNVRMGGCS